MNEYILYLDLDGVITDFDNAFKKISGGIPPEEYRSLYGKDKEYGIVMDQGSQFWMDLEWVEGGREIVNFSLSHFKVVCILTSSGTGKDLEKFKKVQYGKRDWVSRHIPQVPNQNIIVVPFAKMKSNYSGEGRILVDDKDTTIEAWNIKGGVGILHRSSDWKKTLSKLQEYSEGDIKLKEIVETI